MGRYIKKYPRVGFSLGPGEERGFALWVGYELEGERRDLSALGLVAVDDWTEEELKEQGVVEFVPVAPDNQLMRVKLGLDHDPTTRSK
jgi:hypothetical protein